MTSCKCDQLYIDQIKVIGLQKLYSPYRTYSYVIELGLSDDSSTTVTKRYADLAHIDNAVQKFLKKLEEENQQQLSLNRITLPRLEDGKFSLITKRTKSKSIERISDYVNKLIQSKALREILLKFFVNCTHCNDANISYPVSLPLYRVVKSYSAGDAKREISLNENQQVKIVQKCPTGWWLVMTDRQEKGWFPMSYLKVIADFDETCTTSLNPPVKFKVVKDYEAQRDDEMSVRVNDVINVACMHEDGWWLARRDADITVCGYVPAVFLRSCGPETSLCSANCLETFEFPTVDRNLLEVASGSSESVVDKDRDVTHLDKVKVELDVNCSVRSDTGQHEENMLQIEFNRVECLKTRL